MNRDVLLATIGTDVIAARAVSLGLVLLQAEPSPDFSTSPTAQAEQGASAGSRQSADPSDVVAEVVLSDDVHAWVVALAKRLGVTPAVIVAHAADRGLAAIAARGKATA